MSSKVRSFIEAARTVNTITDKITADSKVNADLLENHPSSYFAPVASPTFTGTPIAPTATSGTNTTQIATTAFVKTEVANLIDAAPTALDTLNELAAALGDDANYATTVTTALSTKVAKVTSTDNAIVRFDGTSGAVQNSGCFIDDSGNLGLGTASPAPWLLNLRQSNTYLLNLSNSFGTGVQIQMADQAWSGGLNMTSGALIFQTGGLIERLRLDASGNLGLGVTPSAWYTSLGLKAIQIGDFALVNQTNGYSWMQRNAYTNSSNIQTYISNNYATRYQQGDGQHAWYTAPSGTAGNPITFTQAMTLDASGNLGVGTSSPGTKLDVAGIGGFTTTNPANVLGGQIYVGSSSAYATGNVSGITFSANDSSASLSSYASIQMKTTGDNQGALTFVTRNGAAIYDERMRLDSSGNLGLGVVPSAWSGAYKAIEFPGISVANLNGGTNQQAQYLLNAYDSGTGVWKYKITSVAAAMYRQAADGSHEWHRAPSGTAGNPITFTQAMTLDASGNLGIGTSSPSQKLDVSGTGVKISDGVYTGYLGKGSTFASVGGSAISDFAVRSDNALVFATGGPYLRATLDASGNLGLGVVPSAWYSTRKVLQIGLGGSMFGATDSSSVIGLAGNYYSDSSGVERYLQSAPANKYFQIAGQHQWYTAPSGTAGNPITFTQAMTLDASGSLLLGTTTALNATVNRGNITLNGASTSILNFGVAGSSSGYIFSTTTDLEIAAESTRFMRFSTNGSERMRLDASGNLLVGRTSTVAGARVSAENISGSPSFGAYLPTTGSQTALSLVNPNGVVGSITTSGSSTSYNTSSDYRLKENVQPMTGALAKVAALKPVTYTWKANGSADRGFIAHELQEVIPQAVSGEKDAVDAEGNIQPQGVDYGKITPEIVAALQEAYAIITELKTRIEQLENK